MTIGGSQCDIQKNSEYNYAKLEEASDSSDRMKPVSVNQVRFFLTNEGQGKIDDLTDSTDVDEGSAFCRFVCQRQFTGVCAVIAGCIDTFISNKFGVASPACSLGWILIDGRLAKSCGCN